MSVSHKDTNAVEVTRFHRGVSSQEVDQVIIEQPLAIGVRHGPLDQRTLFTLAVTMRTPGADEDLIRGFLFSEQVISQASDLVHMERVSEDSVVAELSAAVQVDVASVKRDTFTSSSCGACGKTSLEQVDLTIPYLLPRGLPRVTAAEISMWPDLLRAEQRLFSVTGGNHAVGFVEAGRVVLAFEDVGRHNAMDKLIGRLLREGRPPFAGGAVVVSGRASFELVQKALMAGIPILAAVGAPSSLAVDLAQDRGMTLIGFVQQNRFNVYAGAERISFDGD